MEYFSSERVGSCRAAGEVRDAWWAIVLFNENKASTRLIHNYDSE